MLKTAIPLIAFVLMLLSGCEEMHQSVDYDRHSSSNLRTSPASPGVLLFEARVTASAPEETAQGEAVRMQWLEGWLAQRRLCPGGYEILERRKFTVQDANPYRFDLRYELRCVPVAGQ